MMLLTHGRSECLANPGDAHRPEATLFVGQTGGRGTASQSLDRGCLAYVAGDLARAGGLLGHCMRWRRNRGNMELLRISYHYDSIYTRRLNKK